jgi:uncharacterized protein YjbI with pentapeptide repeats
MHFKSICAEIVKLQNESTLSAISHIEYTMLYTNFINHRYIAEVWVYGDKLYLDKNQRMIGEYDISFLFDSFEELWNKLLSERKRYVGKVPAREITTFMINTLPDYYSYLTNIARFAIADVVEQSPFTDITKDDIFKVKIGDYMAYSEPVFIGRKNKDAKKLIELVEERRDSGFIFEDYSYLDFSGCSFTFTDFSYSQFRNTNLNGVTLEGADLTGTNFRYANMENCCMNNCSIYEADYSYANLTNASFVNVCGQAGLPDEKEWSNVGFLPVSFRNADLSNADFTGANLMGADFTGARLDGVDFTYAILDNTIFSDGNAAGV